jgi:hypothetical protein
VVRSDADRGRDPVDALLAEAAGARAGDGDPELEAVALAVLIEDVLDVPLSDADIELATLRDPAAVRNLVERNRGAR